MGILDAPSLTKAAADAAYATQALASTKAPASPVRFAPGLLWGFLGDSITNGSTAGNFSYSYSSQAVLMVGGMVARPDSIEAGTAGETTAQMLARLPALLASGVQALVLLGGTNDANQAVSLTTFRTNVTAIVTAAKAAGIPVVLCTVPPRPTSVAVATRTLIDGYNDWLRSVAPSFSCELADAYAVLVDTTTGGMLAAYDSGDAIHPNGPGHRRIAVEVARAMRRAAGLTETSKVGIVRTVSPTNLITDPLVVGGTVRPAGWFEQPGGTGTAPTYSLVSDTSGVLPAGRWAEMDFDATASGGSRKLSSNAVTTGYAAGDKLLLCAHIQVEDVSGTWMTDVNALTAAVRLYLVNGGTGVPIPPGNTLVANYGVPSQANPAVYNIGPVAMPFTVPAGVTTLNVWMDVQLPTGKRVKARIGCTGLINLTARGSASDFNWAAAMVNT